MFTRLKIASAIVALHAGLAMAQSAPAPATPPPAVQSAPPAQNAPSVAAPAAPQPAVGAPLAGANSFTEGQARDRIAGAGFADVGPLTKDDQGIWRGKAMKDGKSIDVALDYQGNVVAAN